VVGSKEHCAWDILQKRSWSGPSRCPICKNDEETIHHLLIFCPYAVQVCKEVESLIGMQDVWRGQSVDCLKIWCENYNVKSFKGLPFTIAWGLWLVRNDSLFENKIIPAIQVASQALNILKHFKQTKSSKPMSIIVEEEIDKLEAWAFFNGASQGEPPLCGAEGVLYLKDSHFLKFKAGLVKSHITSWSSWLGN
jgi:hypothetical protein